MAHSTVVLGWDGLDHRLAVDFGLADAFAPAHREIETFDNEVLGSPQTYELWPSVLTGLTPREHGLRLLDTGRDDSVLARAAKRTFARLTERSTLPMKALVRGGLALQDRGIVLADRSPDWYREHGLWTLFDGVDARPMAVPNYRTPADDELDEDLGYSRRRAGFIESVPRWKAGIVAYRPTVALSRVENWLASDLDHRLRIVRRHAATHDLVFCWFPYLDVVGHLVPTVGAAVQERAYRVAAEATRDVREALPNETRVVVVSDHGHRDGAHTHSAFFGADADATVDPVADLTDVADGVASC